MNIKRTDIHSPKNIQPEKYDFVVVFSREDILADHGLENTDIFNRHRERTGGKFADHEHGGSCDVCGASFIDYAIFHHAPTNEYVRVGLTCAEKIEAGHADEFRRVAQIRRANALFDKNLEKAMPYIEEIGIRDFVENLFEDGRIGREIRGHRDDNFDIVRDIIGVGDELAPVGSRSYNMLYQKAVTLADLIRNLIKYGRWSEKQQNFAVSLVKFMAAAHDKLFERKQNAKPAPEGKTTVCGVIKSIKVVEGYYGNQIKMVVECNGFAVWSTLPTSLDSAEVGDKVQFNATLTRSDKDESFAFAKRPTKAKIINN